MAKFAATTVFDAMLDLIATATEMYYTNGQPATRTAAIAAQSSAAIVLSGADFVKSGPNAARVLTVAAKSANATVAQNTDHVALCTATTLLYVTTSPAVNTNVGSVINSPAFTMSLTFL